MINHYLHVVPGLIYKLGSLRTTGPRSVLFLLSFAFCACAANSPKIQLQESIRWYTGEAGHVDDNRARRLLEESAISGNPLSIMWLARVYSTGRMTFEADKSKAIQLATTVINEVEALANAGNSDAMLLMATAYAEGLGKAVNSELAVAWYQRAASQGNTLAQHNLGNSYAAGVGVPQDDQLAAQWWLKAARKGDAIPQLRLATAYEQGRGVDKNVEEAIRWYSESAGRGNQAAAAALERLSSP